MQDLTPPLQRRSRDTLDAISNATKELLRTRSFRELTIQEIVGAANSSAGSFYARFKGKRALLHFLHEELAETSLNDMRDFIDAAEFKAVTPAELAELLVPDLVRFHAENRGILRAALVESLDDPMFVERAARLVHATAQIVAEHTTRTASRKDRHVANVQKAMGAVIAILDQSLFFDKRSTHRVSSTEVARLKRIFLASLDSGGEGAR